MSGNERHLIHLASVPIAGHLHDFRQPCLRVSLSLRTDALRAASLVERLERAFQREWMPNPAATAVSRSGRPGADFGPAEAELAGAKSSTRPIVDAVDQLLARLQEAAGLPAAARTVVESVQPLDVAEGTVRIDLAVPTVMPEALAPVTPWVVEQVDAALGGREIRASEVGAVLKHLERMVPGGINTRLLLQAAYRYRVPVTQLPGRVFLYGWGRSSRWLDSTFSDRTSVISARLARDKVLANAMLRRAGLPVAEQIVVRSADEAVAGAVRLGWPVVIKPANLDGGRGVAADIDDEATLRRCFERAWAHSRYLLVEKHIPGNDYRLGVVHGQLAWATHRQPAGVWGDGEHTIAELAEVANRDPNRGTQRWSNMRPLVLDDETDEVLRDQALDRQCRLAPGQFARFRRTSNISAGGTPTPVTDRVHPDNTALAIRAAAVFRLDFAGIDFITPNITRSWLEVGGAICEINGQPQFSVLGPQAPLLAIRGLFDGDGRIPVAVILSVRPADELARALAVAAAAKGLRLASSTGAGMRIGGTEAGPRIGGAVARVGRSSPFDDARALLLDPQVDAVVVVTDGTEWLRTGSPFDRIDALWVDKGADAQARRALQAVCAGEVRVVDDASWGAPEALAADLADALIAADARHRRPWTGEPD